MDTTRPEQSNKSLPPELTHPDDITLTDLEKTLIQNVHKDSIKVIVEKEFKGGFGGTRVFLVSPINPEINMARVVTKVGPTTELRDEKNRYKEFVERSLPFVAAQIWDYCAEGDWAALDYVFAGDGALGIPVTLQEYYQTHSAEDVKNTLTGLLDKELGKKWYSKSLPPELNGFFRDEYEYYLPSHDAMEKTVKILFQNISPAENNDHIKIPGIAETFPHPVNIYPRILNKRLTGQRSLVHGDLHPRNILVDESGKSWLIDFAKVTKRHNLYDFIRLETYLRLMALESGAFSLNEYTQFELTLNADTLGQQGTPPTNAHLSKAYTVIQAIRRTARKYMGPEPDFRNEYFPTLFLHCLAMLKYYPNHGAMPTQLVFITACSLAMDIFEERKLLIDPTPNKDNNMPKEEMQKNSKTTPRSSGNVVIGKNAKDNVIIAGDKNTVNQNRKIDTGGGAYIGGNVNVKNGSFVGRDQHVTQNSGTSVDEIAKAFAIIMDKANQEKNSTKKEKVQRQVQKLEAEARKDNDDVDKGNVEDTFAALANTSADVWDVAIATLSNPIAGISKVFQKIVQRIKSEGKQ